MDVISLSPPWFMRSFSTWLKWLPICEQTQGEPIKQRLRRNTDEAISIGVCGAPTARWKDLWWGRSPAVTDWTCHTCGLNQEISSRAFISSRKIAARSKFKSAALSIFFEGHWFVLECLLLPPASFYPRHKGLWFIAKRCPSGASISFEIDVGWMFWRSLNDCCISLRLWVSDMACCMDAVILKHRVTLYHSRFGQPDRWSESVMFDFAKTLLYRHLK